MRRFRAGIIGAGFIGQVHARALRTVGIELASVATSTPERARAAATALHASRSAASAEELIADPGVDVVHICTPNDEHVRLATLALQAGKSVVCEKPLATSPSEAELLATLARQSAGLATIPFVYRFYPAVREARHRVASGEVGRVVLVHGSYLQDWLASPAESDWRVDVRRGGPSRAFADIGIHWGDLAEFVTGQRIVRVSARLGRAFENRSASEVVDTEDYAAVLFETDSGALGSVLASQVSLGRKNALRLSVDGTEAALGFEQEAPDTLWVGRRDGALRLTAGGPAWSPDARRLSFLPPGHPQGYQDAFALFMADAYGRLSGLAVDGLPTFEDGVRAARLTAAVLRSAAEERWVEVEPAKVGQLTSGRTLV